ncbi:MAG: hypothetical protein WDN49_03785 [Acetobacteraceae bacterium]
MARIKIIGDTKLQMSRLDMVLAEQTGRAVETVDFILRNAMDTVQSHNFTPSPEMSALLAAPHRGRAAGEQHRDRRPVGPDHLHRPSGCTDGASGRRNAAAGLLCGACRQYAANQRTNTGGRRHLADAAGAPAEWSGGPVSRHRRCVFQLSYFQDFYKAVELSEDGAILLHRRDGVVLARNPSRRPRP